MKEMGNLSGVPIEPDEQTKLLDTCVSQAGVIGGGVPGGVFPTNQKKRVGLIFFFSSGWL